MKNISFVRYSPHNSDNALTAQVVECYRQVFADGPWHEWLQCPKCKKYWGTKDQGLLKELNFRHWRTYELLRSMIYSFLSEEITAASLAKAKMYLESYLNIYPMSKDELKKGLRLFYLKSIHIVWVENEHYLENNSRIDEFLYSDVRRTKYLSGNFETLEKLLLK